jgi:DNA-binding NarL/FixJ family response regulator
MQSKLLDAKRALSTDYIVPPLPQARRIDLVVSDCDALNDFDGAGDFHTPNSQTHVRCTIPLAVLSTAVSNETLREAVRLCRPAAHELIGTDQFQHLLESAIGALRRASSPASITNASANRSANGSGSASGNDADNARIERLTPREREVLAHVVAGDPNKCTAAALNISRRTVEHHRAAIMQKTRTKSVSELVRLALRTGLCAAESAND